MIVVKVELWSAINGNVQQLALMSIDNIGGTQQLGDYRTRTYRGRDAEALARALVRETVQREGKVLRHPRLREHVWNLVAKALSSMGYGGARVDEGPALPGVHLVSRKADPACGCPEEEHETPWGYLSMHLNAGKPSDAHLDLGDEGEREVQVTAPTADAARAVLFAWAAMPEALATGAVT